MFFNYSVRFYFFHTGFFSTTVIPLSVLLKELLQVWSTCMFCYRNFVYKIYTSSLIFFGIYSLFHSLVTEGFIFYSFFYVFKNKIFSLSYLLDLNFSCYWLYSLNDLLESSSKLVRLLSAYNFCLVNSNRSTFLRFFLLFSTCLGVSRYPVVVRMVVYVYPQGVPFLFFFPCLSYELLYSHFWRVKTIFRN